MADLTCSLLACPVPGWLGQDVLAPARHPRGLHRNSLLRRQDLQGGTRTSIRRQTPRQTRWLTSPRRSSSRPVQGGNDYEIFEDERTIGHAVTCPEDTMKLLNELFLAGK
jgi:hypothetical protein